MANAKVPIWIENEFLEIPVYVVDGNLELLLGQDFLTKFKVAIDCARRKLKYGQGKWIAAVLGDKGLLRIPTVPVDTKVISPNEKCIRKREKYRNKLDKIYNNNYNVNYTEFGSICPNLLKDALQHIKSTVDDLPKLGEFLRKLLPSK